MSQKCVEDDSEADDCHDEKSSVPALKHIRWIVQHDESLDHSADDEGDGGETCLPSQGRDPADHVTEKPLAVSGRKFRHPVVLASSCGGPSGDH